MTLVTLAVQKDGGKLGETKMRAVETNGFHEYALASYGRAVAISLAVV